jgi:GNAT superfamily N-acetyltransferase
MADFTIRPVRSEERDWIRRLLCEYWAADFVIVRGEIHHPADLPGFIAESGSEKTGLLTYRIDGADCEIMTLNSLVPSRGIGGALLEAVKESARRAGCRRLRVVTTNDNLRALRFYQRKGFTLAALRPNVLEETRKRKPIPQIGEDGIPLRDEIELEMMLE